MPNLSGRIRRSNSTNGISRIGAAVESRDRLIIYTGAVTESQTGAVEFSGKKHLFEIAKVHAHRILQSHSRRD